MIINAQLQAKLEQSDRDNDELLRAVYGPDYIEQFGEQSHPSYSGSSSQYANPYSYQLSSLDPTLVPPYRRR